MSINNSIFCTAPFSTVRIESWSKESTSDTRNLGTVFKPGCVYIPTTTCGSLGEYLHGDDMENHRQNLLSGSVPRSNCKLCAIPENNGMISIRKKLNSKPWASDKKNIKLLDVFFGNTCNLGCVMCTPEYSSFLSNEMYKVGLIDYQIKHKNNIGIAIDTIDQLPELISVSFIGGEFFLIEDNIKILEKIKQRNLTATIITNGTIINQQMIKMLKEIKNLEIRISIDGYKEGFEFIRYPAVWNDWVNNVALLRQELPHADICCSMVLQMLVCQQIHELYEWANHSKLRITHQMLSSPSSLRFSVLEPQERNSLIKLLQQKQSKGYYIAKPQKIIIQNLITMIETTESNYGHRSQFLNLISKLCAHRKISDVQIQKQFGVLSDLANEVIDQIGIIKHSNILTKKV